LKDLGYQYVNIDDCWAAKNRNSNGDQVPDPVKWPNGIKAVADQIHGMGLKFGLYGCSGTSTCAGYPGSHGYETKDANLLASWGVDYWKYDNCYTPGGNSSGRFMTMRDALAKSGRPIFYSLCQWGNDNVWTWGNAVGNSWRATGDIENNWNSIVKIGSFAGTIPSYSGPGGFNDFDMMVHP
jgi:alpha-galactosidase